MRTLKTMHPVPDVKKDSFAPPNLGENPQLQRRGAKTLEKVKYTKFF
jgi:hypothetical protein